MTEHIDETLQRAIGVLSELPPLDRDAVARITAEASRERARERGATGEELVFPARRQRLLSLRAASGLAAAAAIVGFFVHAALVGPVDSPAAGRRSPVAPAPTAAILEASAPASLAAVVELAPVPTQFVIDRAKAQRVAIVGDFNGWGGDTTTRIELTRVPGSSLWTATVPLVPGRHRYAFLVDDSVWTPDPRAPRADDADFGVAGSVVVVGRP